MIDDQRGIDHLGRVKCLSADTVLGFGEHTVAAVLRAAHDEVGDNILFIIRGAAENDAAAGICVAHQLLADVKNILAHNAVTPVQFLWTIAPSTRSLPAQKSDTACGRRIHSAFCMTRFCKVSGVSPSSTSTALLRDNCAAVYHFGYKMHGRTGNLYPFCQRGFMHAQTVEALSAEGGDERGMYVDNAVFQNGGRSCPAGRS